MEIFSSQTPWNSLLRKPWVGYSYSTIVICRKLAGVRPMPTSVINMTIKTRWSTIINWMMVGRGAGPRPRSISHNAIKTFSNIEQVIVVDLFSPTSMSFTLTPTISSSVGRVAGVEPISNSPITINSISWKSQQYTTFTLVRGWIVAGRRPISTSPFNINSCYPIARVRVAGLLWPRSTYINISSATKRGRVASHTWPTPKTSTITWWSVAGLKRPMSTTFTTSTMTWVRVAGLKRPMSMTLLPRRHFKTFFLGNFVSVVTTAGIRMDGITRPLS